MPTQSQNFTTIAGRLRWLRHQRAATLAETAKATGLGLSYISRLESGSRVSPSAKSAAALAIFYQANREWIISGTGTPFAADALESAKAKLYATLLESDALSEGETRLDNVLSNLEVRVRQLRFSNEKKRAQYLKEIWDELAAYSAECGRNFPKVQEALLRVDRENAAKEGAAPETPA